jgi:hypothetical protein
MFEQSVALVVFELRRASWTLYVVGRLFDRLFGESIEPVADGFLHHVVAFSKPWQCITLFSADRGKDSLPRNPSIRLLSDFVELF